MSSQEPIDPRLEQATVSDDSLISAHEKASAGRPDTDGHYRLMPLALLFLFCGFIFYAGSYLNRFSGKFSADIFDERQAPGGAVVAAPKIDPIALGKKLYVTCASCHQASGLGAPGIFPPLAGSDWVTGSEERLISILLHGLKGPLTVKGVTYGAAAMPAFGKGSGYDLSDEKVAAVLTYIRQEWGNEAGLIDTSLVTEIRNRGDRKEWTEAELLQIQ